MRTPNLKPGTGTILPSDRTYLTLSHLIEATHTRHLSQLPLFAYS